ncbi:unnamed protein product [Oppiella nova]|uniref:Nitroreductase domain-containing protein n=1 Tax=Oppiella nova TaxID=334625 RepID=A0A7R9QP59_9ACAR|nr:unnamed protein product [Oppiella nova]CAG2170455.1 unnamed protein product [Oppiella nova]
MTKDHVNYVYDPVVLKGRNTEHPVHPLILSRSSPREMSGEDIPDRELMALFDAARWAPSYRNAQPWRFLYAKRSTVHWQKFLDIVKPANQAWCHTASALVVVVAHKWTVDRETGKPKEIPTASFDTGAACMALALEGSGRDLVVHCMFGMDFEKAYKVFGIDRDRDGVQCMIAVGKRPALTVRDREPRVSQRNPIESFAFEGGFVKVYHK